MSDQVGNPVDRFSHNEAHSKNEAMMKNWSNLKQSLITMAVLETKIGNNQNYKWALYKNNIRLNENAALSHKMATQLPKT